MFRWIPYAFVRVAVFFMLGIWLGIALPQYVTAREASACFLFLLIFYLIVVSLVRQKRLAESASYFKLLAGVVGLIAVFLAGYLNVLVSAANSKPDHFMHIGTPLTFVKVIVTNSPQEKSNSWKAEAVIPAVQTGDRWQRCGGNVLLYFSKQDFPVCPNYGDVFLIKGGPQIVPPPSNPDEFDYQRFLSFKNIYHQKYVRKSDVLSIGNEPPSLIDGYALDARAWADITLQNVISGDREKALASGLVLGITDGLDDEVLSAYKATGAMHVLAVSGLHVGILYSLIMLVLRPLQRGRYGVVTTASISVVILWAYAFVTGLSPSVLRAVSMFSFVALAKPIRRRTNIYNTLAASAFFILLYDPFMLMSVGFQLSYLAVLGIVYIQPGIYLLWEPSSRIADEIWKVSAVSIAAQLATFPIGLYYFHQFPNYFLLSNLFVIPASFVVLVLGILILILQFIPPIASALGFVLEWTIKLSNYIVFWIEDLPYSVIENIYITPVQAWLLAFIVVTLLLLLQLKKFYLLILSVCLTLIFSAAQWHHYLTEFSVSKITVYNIPRHSAVDVSTNGECLFFSDSILQNDVSRLNYHIVPHRIRRGISSATSWPDPNLKVTGGCRVFAWDGKVMIQIFNKKYTLPDHMKFDVIIISNNAVGNVQQLAQIVNARAFVLDASNTWYHADKLVKEAATLKIPIHSVLHHGAFEQQL